jgi:hypothetical protein
MSSSARPLTSNERKTTESENKLRLYSESNNEDVTDTGLTDDSADAKYETGSVSAVLELNMVSLSASTT